jgi:putative radical SAM enzyme (TIGR03279 family)
MPKRKGQLIVGSVAGSIAAELGLASGDRLLTIDGRPVRDIFDYRLRQLSDALVVRIEHPDGSLTDYEIEKDEDEDLGLEFADELLDTCTHCHNRCVFCFIDQLPPGMRPSLYFKDDDLRLSFLNGNYVTLTNLTDRELDRLIAYRFSPMNVSVHTTDPDLRVQMMKNPKAGSILTRLQRIAAAGLCLNTQIVLCPDWNDGAALERTLTDLSSLQPAVQSIAIVPVGLTRYRAANQLPSLRPFTPEECRAVLATVERFQTRFLERSGSRVVHAADEFYLRAGRPIPPADEYDDFPQLENGVGMIALFRQTLAETLADPLQITGTPPAGQAGSWPERPDMRRILLVTGTLAAGFLTDVTAALSRTLKLPLQVAAIENRFFGPEITVAGLVTGQDILRQLAPQLSPADLVLVPSCMLKADAPVFLDDLSLADLAASLGVPVWAVRPDAGSLIQNLVWLNQTLRSVS